MSHQIVDTSNASALNAADSATISTPETTSPSPARKSSKGGVQSVERTFVLLEFMADRGGSATLSELSEMANLPMPTIYRLLRTLSGQGYVRQLHDRGYTLGPGLIRLGDIAGRKTGDIAEPQLRTLVAALGETANVAVLNGDMVVYVSQVPSLHSMRMFTEVGRRAHPSATGVGKAILAGLDQDQVRQIVATSGMPKSTDKSLADLPSLEAELEKIRAQGYAVDEEEQELGVRCFAVEVKGAPLPMAVSVSGPVTRVHEEFADKAVPMLQSAAEEISAALQRPNQH